MKDKFIERIIKEEKTKNILSKKKVYKLYEVNDLSFSSFIDFYFYFI